MTAQARRAPFITLEGIDGAGKTTHVVAIADWIRAQGARLVQTREPGGTALGEQLRGLLLAHEMHAETELLLMFAARSEHLQRVIRPALARGDWVLSDRFTDASVAYQGGGRALGTARVEALESWLHADLTPDLTLLFDLDPAIAAQRMQTGRSDRDRFEREQIAFFARVRTAYLARASDAGGRCVVIDAALPPDAVRNDILAALDALARRIRAV